MSKTSAQKREYARAYSRYRRTGDKTALEDYYRRYPAGRRLPGVARPDPEKQLESSRKSMERTRQKPDYRDRQSIYHKRWAKKTGRSRAASHSDRLRYLLHIRDYVVEGVRSGLKINSALVADQFNIDERTARKYLLAITEHYFPEITP